MDGCWAGGFWDVPEQQQLSSRISRCHAARTWLAGSACQVGQELVLDWAHRPATAFVRAGAPVSCSWLQNDDPASCPAIQQGFFSRPGPDGSEETPRTGGLGGTETERSDDQFGRLAACLDSYRSQDTDSIPIRNLALAANTTAASQPSPPRSSQGAKHYGRHRLMVHRFTARRASNPAATAKSRLKAWWV